MITCKDCSYWGGSDSVDDTRICYMRDIYSKEPLEFKHKDDSCEWRRNNG